MLINVEGVSIAITNKILQEHILHVSTSTIGLDHHHLVRMHGVDIPIDNVGDIDILSKGTKRRSTTPITVDVLD